ncbi:unnamed protein product [Moneuplotes crassus]|uniref:Uncharacterized protein n=1 Tax=Euplotes crassus TaxID=5936 RepID=A0AAD1UFP6_EUPCR|nr:unnamed protein product [Moneuplotes crassus]
MEDTIQCGRCSLPIYHSDAGGDISSSMKLHDCVTELLVILQKVIAVNNKNETKLKECTRMIEEFKQAKNYQFPDDAHHESELEYLRKERDRLFEENTLLKYGMGGQSQQIQPEFAIEEGQSHNDSFVSRVSSLQISGDSIHSDSVRLEDRSGPNRGSVLQTGNNMEEFPSLGGGNDPVSTNSKRSSKWDSGPNLNNIMRKPNNKKPKKSHGYNNSNMRDSNFPSLEPSIFKDKERRDPREETKMQPPTNKKARNKWGEYGSEHSDESEIELKIKKLKKRDNKKKNKAKNKKKPHEYIEPNSNRYQSYEKPYDIIDVDNGNDWGAEGGNSSYSSSNTSQYYGKPKKKNSAKDSPRLSQKCADIAIHFFSQNLGRICRKPLEIEVKQELLVSRLIDSCG